MPSMQPLSPSAPLTNEQVDAILNDHFRQASPPPEGNPVERLNWYRGLIRRAAAAGVPAPARLVNGQWEGQPLSQFPELQAEVRKGLADGTLEVTGGVAAVAPTHEARRWCKGDEEWTNWQPVAPSKLAERQADSTFQVRPIAGVASVAPAQPLNGVAATVYHDEGAYAQCGACGRYTLDPMALSARPRACECGEKLGWCGSFKHPGADAKWSNHFKPAPGVAIPAPSINDLAREACAALATVHYDHMGKVCADVERCFDAAKALYAAPPASVMVVPTTDTDMRGGIADYLCAAGLDMKLAEDMALDLMRYIRTGVWGDVGAKGG